MRKQVYDLTLADLGSVSVWEYALDEEGVEGQDEATVRPHAFGDVVDPSDGTLIVRARFDLADGTQHMGFLTISSDDSRDMGALQPVIVCRAGQIGFWHGSLEPSRAELTASYQRLGKTEPGQVFPIRFLADVPLACGPVRGEIDGFFVLEDWRTGQTRVLR